MLNSITLPANLKSYLTKKRPSEIPEIALFLLGLSLLNLFLFIWSSYDHALPVYDMACHLLSGFSFADLLKHAHPAHRYWWQALFLVNPLYPPFVYFVYGIFKFVFGAGRWVELAVQQFFSSLLFSSIYGLGKSIFGSYAVALLAAFLIFTFPAVFTLAHYDMLDIPGLSMVALSLFCFVHWQKCPSIISSVILGIICTLTTLTKNNSIAFIVTPFIVSLLSALKEHNWSRYKYFAIVTFTGTVTLLPWLIIACRTMLKIVVTYQNADCNISFVEHLIYYLLHLPNITSYFIFAIFVMSLFAAGKQTHKQMLFINASAVGSVFILSLFRWTQQFRYALPISIPIALYCAKVGITYFKEDKFRYLTISMMFLVCFLFIENSFTPYPLPRLYLPESLDKFFGVEPIRINSIHAPGGTSSYPTPPDDWGYAWAFTKIGENMLDSKQPKYSSRIEEFAIMPDSEEVSATSYAYLARRNNLPLHAFTPRNYTLLGDEFCFRPDIAKTIDWYLLKTGSINSPASHFCNKESERAYAQWCNYVRNSAFFQLIGKKPLPDGSILELYKKAELNPVTF